MSPELEILEPLAKIEGLKKSFFRPEGEVPVLKGIDLTTAPRETIAVVGVSGAGKSTLLHLLGALDRPTAGRVLLEGQDLFQLPSAELARVRNAKVGFVFQFHHLLPEFNTLENTMMPGLIAGLARSEAEGRAEKILGELGLSHRLTTARASFPAASSSAWPWPGPCSSNPA
jgi:lipoprotein-releasing system ATP-binding protein